MNPFNSKLLSENASLDIFQLAEEIRTNGEISQRDLINNHSPYSVEINDHIVGYEELRYYCGLGLREAKVTRTSLIQAIDLDLFIKSKGKTNLELMLGGNPPYLYDSPEGMVELHHIGQDFDAPFAELSDKQHMQCGNNKALHTKEVDSWRNDPKKEKLFRKERKKYWKMRTKNKTEEVSTDIRELPIYNGLPNTLDIWERINSAINVLISACTSDQLQQIINTASTQKKIKEAGVSSFNNWLLKNASDGKPICPQCGSDRYDLHGAYTSRGEKMQRYECKSCGKTYTALYKTILSESKLTFAQWIEFINSVCNGDSTVKTASLLGISTKSVQSNKLRLFYALILLNEKTRLEGNIVLDETFIADSFKGNRSKSKGFVMDRKSRKRGKDIRKRGVSTEQVSIVTALDERGISVAKVAGLGGSNAYAIQKVLGDAIDADRVGFLYSDKSTALKKYANMNEFEIKQSKLYKKKKAFKPEEVAIQRHLQIMNSYHSRLKRFMGKFYGVSTAFLPGYLALFAWKDRTRHEDISVAYEELFAILTQPNLYKSIEKIKALPCFQRPLSFKPADGVGKFNFAEAEVIYAEYASGKSKARIAREQHMGTKRVSDNIKNFIAGGFAYQTEKEKRAEELAKQVIEIKNPFTVAERNHHIYLERLEWKGSAKEFFQATSIKYGLSAQRLRNIISEEKRILSLQETVYCNQEFEYKTTDKIYALVLEDFNTLSKENLSINQIAKRIAKKYGYTQYNICRILALIKANPMCLNPTKKRTSKDEAIRRDKAILVDFLNWEGTKSEFKVWAAGKYNLTAHYVHQILNYSFTADFKRYEVTYDPPKPRKG